MQHMFNRVHEEFCTCTINIDVKCCCNRSKLSGCDLLLFFVSVTDPPVINAGFSTEPSFGDVTIGNAGCHRPGTPTSIVCEVIVLFMTPYNVTLEKDGVQVAFIESDKSTSHTFSADSPGTYTCTASNIFGSDSASSLLYGNV